MLVEGSKPRFLSPEHFIEKGLLLEDKRGKTLKADGWARIGIDGQVRDFRGGLVRTIKDSQELNPGQVLSRPSTTTLEGLVALQSPMREPQRVSVGKRFESRVSTPIGQPERAQREALVFAQLERMR